MKLFYRILKLKNKTNSHANLAIPNTKEHNRKDQQRYREWKYLIIVITMHWWLTFCKIVLPLQVHKIYINIASEYTLKVIKHSYNYCLLANGLCQQFGLVLWSYKKICCPPPKSMIPEFIIINDTLYMYIYHPLYCKTVTIRYEKGFVSQLQSYLWFKTNSIFLLSNPRSKSSTRSEEKSMTIHIHTIAYMYAMKHDRGNIS